jgi:hypothetical protein
MFNFRISGIAAGAAFIVSFLLGIVNGAGFPVLLFRALGFGVLFFVLFCVVFWLLGQFVPELLSGTDDILDAPGSTVNLSVGSGPIEGAFPTGDFDELDNIDARISPGRFPARDKKPDFSAPAGKALDQDGEEGYNEGAGPSAEEETDKRSGRNSGEIDLVPDFDTLSEAFLPDSGSDTTVVFDTPEPKKTSVGASQSQSFGGDFNPKELAQAIRTVLKKEEKG